MNNRTKTKGKVQSKRTKMVTKDDESDIEEEETTSKKQEGGNRMVLRSRTKPRKVWNDDEFIEEENQNKVSPALPKRAKKKVENKNSEIAINPGSNTTNAKRRTPRVNPASQPPETSTKKKTESPNDNNKQSTLKRKNSMELRNLDYEDTEAAVSLMGLADIALMTLEKKNPAQSTAASSQSNTVSSSSSGSLIPNSVPSPPTTYSTSPTTLPPPQSLYGPTALTEEHRIDSSHIIYPKEELESEPIEKTTGIPAPPSFASFRLFRGNPSILEPDIIFNSKRYPFKRCATHVAIAYYIFYSQRYVAQQSQYSEHFNNLDPTFEARILKVKTERSRTNQIQYPGRHLYDQPVSQFFPQDNLRPISWNLPQTYNNFGLQNSPREPFNSPIASFETKDPTLTLPPVKNPMSLNRGKVEALLDNSDLDRNVNLFPKIIVNPEDTKLSTVVNPNLVTTHEIKTTPISSLQSQLPIDQQEHIPVFDEFAHPKSESSEIYLKTMTKPPNYVNVGNKFKFTSPNSKEPEGGEITDSYVKFTYPNVKKRSDNDLSRVLEQPREFPLVTYGNEKAENYLLDANLQRQRGNTVTNEMTDVPNTELTND